MKKIIVLLMIICFLPVLFSCNKAQNNLSTEVTNMIDEKYVLEGRVDKINETSIEITITNSKGASGTYVVNIYKDTQIYDKFGNEIGKNQIAEGNIVEIGYNGQVTKSFPPQVNARKIQVK